MKLAIFLVLIIFSSFIVSAIVSEPNFIYDGVISGGIEEPGINPITNVNFLGYICSSADCTTVSSMFLNSENFGGTNFHVINYPTINLSAFGYGIYFYKDGFIPCEALSTWYGSGTTPDQKCFLYKKDFCTSNSDDLNITGIKQTNQKLKISARLYAAINNSGPLNYTPAEIKDQYSHIVKSTLYIKNKETGEIFILSNFYNIYFSSFQQIEFFFTPKTAGNYTFNLTTSVPDAKCLNSINQSKKVDNLQIIEPTPIITIPTILINSPENKTYNTSYVLVSILAENASQVWWSDGISAYPYNNSLIYTFQDGSHTITAYANNSAGLASRSLTFYINTSANSTTPPATDITPPTITIIYPESKEYSTSNIPLEITTNEDAAAYFSLDGNSNILMPRLNSTHFIYNLEGLTEGNHVIIFYAADVHGNTANKSISFSIKFHLSAKDNKKSNQCKIKEETEDQSAPAEERIMPKQANNTILYVNSGKDESISKEDFNTFYVSILIILIILFLIILIRLLIAIRK
jgi:hypothetical protein